MDLKHEIDNYFKNKDNIEKLLFTKYEKKMIIDKDIINNQIIISANKKIILKFTYYFIGSFDLNKSIWIWTYNNFLLDNSNKSFTNKIINFKEEIKNNYPKYKKTKNDIYEKYLYYLSNEICYIEKSNILDIMKLSMYILNGIGTFREYDIDNSINKINFYIIKNINLNNL